MEYKIMHRAYTPIKGGSAIPQSKTINELGKMAIHYIGTFSEYYPIDLKNNLLTYIRKNWTSGCQQPQKHIILSGLKLKGACSHCGGNVCNNNGVSFTKQDLLRIANSMDDTDTMDVVVTDYIKDKNSLIQDINKTIK